MPGAGAARVAVPAGPGADVAERRPREAVQRAVPLRRAVDGRRRRGRGRRGDSALPVVQRREDRRLRVLGRVVIGVLGRGGREVGFEAGVALGGGFLRRVVGRLEIVVFGVGVVDRFDHAGHVERARALAGRVFVVQQRREFLRLAVFVLRLEKIVFFS